MTTLQLFYDETAKYNRNLEIVIKAGDEQFQIDGIFFNGKTIVIESSQLETPASMGKKGGKIGGKIGGKAKVKKGFAVSGKSGRKSLTEEQLALLPKEKQEAILKRRQKIERSKQASLKL